VLAGLTGDAIGGYKDRPINAKQPDSAAVDRITDADELDIIIDEGRRQIDTQVRRIEYASTRAQILLVFAIAVIGYIASKFAAAGQLEQPWKDVSRWLMLVGLGLLAYGAAGSGAVLTTRVTLTRPDTTDLANGGAGVRKRLAVDYAESVILGENTAASRITNLRISVLLVVLGLLIGFSGVVMSLWA
jgi:hypothetical protein